MNLKLACGHRTGTLHAMRTRGGPGVAEVRCPYGCGWQYEVSTAAGQVGALHRELRELRLALGAPLRRLAARLRLS